jgi:hypothetical protein
MLSVQVSEAFLEVQRRVHAIEVQAEPHHRKSDLRLDTDNDRFRSAQSDHVGDVPQTAAGEGVHDVQSRNIHDESAGTEFAYLLHHRVPQIDEIAVGKGGLDRGDQVGTLFEDWNLHRSPV